MTTDICVIVPTIRPDEFRDCLGSYAENAREHGFDTDRLHVVVVTEDDCDATAMRAALMDETIEGRVFDGAARETWFGANDIAEYQSLIPAASHAQTSFGLLYLWANDYPYGVFLDDDTRAHPSSDFFGTHLANLTYEGAIETVGSDEQWVNVLYQHHDEHGLYPRGYPYGAMGETVETEETHVSDVVASQGLWTNVPDLDAVRILWDGDLDGQAQTRLTADDYGDDFVAARGNYLTVCSMNLAFRREVVPAFYQLPMDDNEFAVGRFDDIWSGVFLKRACDVLDKRIYNGAPLCRHDKAPRSTFGDLAYEAAGLGCNEYLWEVIDDAGAGADSYAAVFDAMAGELIRGDWSEIHNGAFLTTVGHAMRDWLDCLEALDRVPATADD
jgi:hypothetical protein